MNLPSVYEPGKYEADIYRQWEKSRVFEANPHSSKPHFSISMPPPNETGTLHVGHALFLTLQDILARHARQTGHDVLWLPGTDHAALATNALVEKQLTGQGTDKHQLGREAFITTIKEFVGTSRNTINSQIRAMGASCDWSRVRYTLDDALNRCVNEVFVKMYNDGLIYRGHRIVNWDPNLETTVSDDEVEHKDQSGTFYTLKYGPFEIGTARPETKFGDKYVVMHPDDKRYAQYQHGQTFEAEWLNGKVTATVIKDEAVDPKFGTGVMTITPWHDHTDFEIAERHGLEKEPIIDLNGKLLAIAGDFAGMTIDTARPKIVDKLQQRGLLIKEDKNYRHSVATNSRGGGIIEPQVMLQWFVDVNRPAVQWKGQLRSLRQVMRAVVEDGDIKITPRRFEKVYYHWIDNLRDWCISRQIWWGHQIPVWYKTVESRKSKVESQEIYVGVQPPEGDGWRRDADTLDTWFSSALWTWSTLINPDIATDFSLSLEQLLERSPDFKAYHPTSVMETGWDILFFWVARMILATTYATGQVPFKTVYLHGLVRTESGRKMSKSDPETIIDPLEVIPQYGTDALRLALISGVGAGNDQRLGRSKIVDNRNFCNKLWNIARYVETAGHPSMKLGVKGAGEPKSLADHWILNKLSILTEVISKDLANFRFGEAYQNLYHFIWDDLADWYIEASKSEPNPALLRYVLSVTLTVAHPFAPFITEAVWQQLGLTGLLAAEQLPKVIKSDKAPANKFEEIKNIISEARRLGAELGVKKPRLYYRAAPFIEEQEALISRLGRLSGVIEAETARSEGVRLINTSYDCWLDIDRQTAQAYRQKLESAQKDQQQSIDRLKDRLANKNYLSKAPKELIEETSQQLADEQAKLKAIKQELAAFEKALKS
ncbi:MAG TPA: valine--tRNA ligase [Candidatus Saccharimonadales bacterium]|nr:valine--tRNA ligase [Candidatus Saccharimonadales bacterium]